MIPVEWLDILGADKNTETMHYRTRAGRTLPETIAPSNSMSADEVRELNPEIDEWPVEPGTSVRVR